jgi:hypothetical protein
MNNNLVSLENVEKVFKTRAGLLLHFVVSTCRSREVNSSPSWVRREVERVPSST